MEQLSGFTLITGGVRSGKSAFAEELAYKSGKKTVYLATARAEDPEMRERVNQHRRRRPAGVITVEEPLKPHLTLERYSLPGQVILVDCLTLLVTNLFLADLESRGAVQQGEDIFADEIILEQASKKALDYIEHFSATAVATGAAVLAVTNEVGMGVVPEYPVGRYFRDTAGRANQIAAAAADRVYFVVCGIPQRIK